MVRHFLSGFERARISVPRAVFIKHQLLTPNNLTQHYGRELRAAKGCPLEERDRAAGHRRESAI
jgi:hypothetical protein